MEACSFMDLATLLLSCSLHADDALLTAVAYAHSRGNPYVVTNVRLDVLIAQDEPPLAPTSLAAARASMTRILEAGGEPIVGLLPARLAWADQYGKTTSDLLDPCANIAVTSAKISEFDYACRRMAARSSAAPRRACTLDRYGASVGLPALRKIVVAILEWHEPWPEALIVIEQASTSTASRSEVFFSLSITAPLLPVERASAARVSSP
jgi:hypothetical protein